MAKLVDVSRIIFKPVTVSFLQMNARPAHSTNYPAGVSCELLPKPISVEAYRHFYYGVGEMWQWLDRMVMDDAELSGKINAANIDIYVLKVDNQDAGFAEFVFEGDYTEILYFGLFPSFVGKGLGSWFLQWVIEKAWSYGPKWIQLNTCTLDHPNALAVYQKGGFKLVRTETHQRRVLI